MRSQVAEGLKRLTGITGIAALALTPVLGACTGAMKTMQPGDEPPGMMREPSGTPQEPPSTTQEPPSTTQEPPSTTQEPPSMTHEPPAGAVQVGEDHYMVPADTDANGCARFRPWSGSNIVTAAIYYCKADGSFTLNKEQAGCAAG